jgi:hypothetical protein
MSEAQQQRSPGNTQRAAIQPVAPYFEGLLNQLKPVVTAEQQQRALIKASSDAMCFAIKAIAHNYKAMPPPAFEAWLANEPLKIEAITTVELAG